MSQHRYMRIYVDVNRADLSNHCEGEHFLARISLYISVRLDRYDCGRFFMLLTDIRIRSFYRFGHTKGRPELNTTSCHFFNGLYFKSTFNAADSCVSGIHYPEYCGFLRMRRTAGYRRSNLICTVYEDRGRARTL
jgi:hypothetical protein